MMTLAVARFRAWGPCVNTGFNSIPFDLPFWQHQAFQTLYPPYDRQVDGHVHHDALKMLRLATVLEPGELAVAIVEGVPTFRLGPSARANGIHFPEETAHDAHADLTATMALTRLIRTRVPRAYDAISFLAVKRNVLDFVRNCPAMSLLEWKDGMPRALPVAFIGQNPGNMSEVALFDLGHDPDRYVDLSIEELMASLDGEVRPIRTIKANKIPMLQPTAALPPDLAAHEVDEAELDSRARRIATHLAFRAGVQKALARRLAERPIGTQVEQQLYGRFITDADAALCRRFHQARWSDRHSIAGRLTDDRLRRFAERLLFEHAPDGLPEDIRARVSGEMTLLSAMRRAEHKLTEDHEPPAIAETERQSPRDGALSELQKHTTPKSPMKPIQSLMQHPSRIPQHLSFAREPSVAELAWRFAVIRGARDDALDRCEAFGADTHYRLFLAHGFFFDICLARGVAAATVEKAQRRLGMPPSRTKPDAFIRLAGSRTGDHLRELGIAFPAVSLPDAPP